jgi:hypothetical protein
MSGPSQASCDASKDKFDRALEKIRQALKELERCGDYKEDCLKQLQKVIEEG